MARTLSEIYQEICENFVNNEVVQQRYQLTPGQTFEQQFSNVSIEAALFYTIALAIWTLEQLFGSHVKWINKKALEIRNGNTYYYERVAREYQEGDALVWNAQIGEYRYPDIDEETQIIKYAAAVETQNGVILKVAMDNNGEPEPLTDPQKEAFAEYMRLRKFAGVIVFVVSREPDLCRLFYRVYYNPLVLNADGSLISNPAIKPVEVTIENRLKNLEFNGILNITALTDDIQNTEGVLNPVFISGVAKYGDLPFAPINDFYTANAGYIRIDEDLPLVDTIEYIPYQQ